MSLAVLCCAAASFAQVRPSLITSAPNGSRLYTLAGNTRPEVQSGADLGAVADDTPLEHMLLQLTRSTSSEQALAEQIALLHNPNSPDFHKWMTAAEFGQAYGASRDDRAALTAWLESSGFTVNSVAPGGMTIDFSGTAAAVRSAFHTEIHYIQVNGVRHLANVTDPQIPEAFAAAVKGVVSMHDFTPRPMKQSSRKQSQAKFTFTDSSGNTNHAVTPGDLAAIYNFNPLFSAGVTGKGQTIAVVEDSNLYSAQDWTIFRQAFGLDQYASGTLTTVHPASPSGVNNCKDPGVVAGDDGEAILDAEWASAAAPDAAIVVAGCASTRTTFGGLIALQNLVNSPNPPAIVSVSYGVCEAENGAAGNAAFNAIYQQAVAEGISIFAAAGDEGAASCDAEATGATHGIGVSGYASTPYNVAVGATDFSDTVDGTSGAYWSPTNSSTYVSALQYIPEIPWNDSCADPILAGYYGYSTVYGPTGFCGSSTAKSGELLTVTAGSGGPSGCASGSPATPGVVSGTCAGYAKPSWQSGLAGIVPDAVRDIPDVSLFAANGVWGHYLVDCWSNTGAGGSSCAGDPGTWDGGGGSSYSTPIFAGIQALVNQKYNGAQGNPNPILYKLASIGANSCNSATASAGCVFHNITRGSIEVNCGGSVQCFGSSPATGNGRGNKGVYDGALSLSTTNLDSAYDSSSGWNFTTGLGSVDVYNLVMQWTSGQ